MKFLALIPLLFSISAYGETELNCDHSNILVSPLPKAPTVTELKVGSVILRFNINEGGMVEDIRVVETTGDKRWVDSFKRALQKRSYIKPTIPYEQVCKFSGEFEVSEN